ncbi:TPA: hypothetical protein DD449_05420 [Candidatus Berkelbacteria bacterium]|uniref:Uncharacterized protein n=1 Tax=Berkelbacteria bacterium GW2011_GWE1_39_12 TaxID=1618337 RepID=A0A0G4B299_9BACT|nr:MAG: hypothetical protein UT28_C0001G0157 [Berkelbacteria bacterium GW2011_GWE1_39_12]HBO61083.1 hypothetical protein [Candidatus Berkelbacteria bacterium]
MFVLAAWMILGLVGGIFCLWDDGWNIDWLDEMSLMYGFITCVTLGPILLFGVSFLIWWSCKYRQFVFPYNRH